ncbi:MAG TPA: hypothetical protein VEQ60_25360, partial [Longimicrobium sp.]|nr:hypothetical protein [Longimicrobium sp.]
LGETDEGGSEHGRGGGGGGNGGDGGDDGLPGRCNPPDERVKRLNAAWLRGQLIQALRELLVARYCRFCWHQQRIDLTTDRDRDRAALDAFRKRRRDEFIMEARDVEGDDEEGGSAAAGGRAGRGSYESRPQAGDDDQNQP